MTDAAEKGPVTVPRGFAPMDRAAIGLGGVFLHLRADLNFHRLFEAAMEDFSARRAAKRQAKALAAAGLDGAQGREPMPYGLPPVGNLDGNVIACGTENVSPPAIRI